jgi:UDP-2-acetamido-3-amino-2,3-dideoxy-glucuronate N-acetyltransferase
MSNFIHKSSYVDEGVELGDNTNVWHFSHILKGTITGQSCSFGQNCVVGPEVKLGDRVKVQNNITIHDRVEIGDDVLLGPSVSFVNAVNRRSFICRKFAMKWTKIGNGVTVGANATIVRGSEIGEYAIVGAGAYVNGEVKPYSQVEGVPAVHTNWVGKSGDPLEFDAEGNAVDEFTNTKYKLENECVTEI